MVDPPPPCPYGRRPRRARSSGVEHLTFNQRADGSIPSGLTKRPAASTGAGGDQSGFQRTDSGTRNEPFVAISCPAFTKYFDQINAVVVRTLCLLSV